ncbi:molecular chaperone [Comamonas sp. J-3]|uniref:fimbrial biogenesis chaperone n=1 Tax=Comamonas trifloxystrobinivorans TaxID=3350256 RepID=UPI003729D8DB
MRVDRLKAQKALLASVLWTSLYASTALAGGLEVSPTSLQLNPQANSEELWLSNVGNTPISAQVRVFAWSQKEGADYLAATTALTISPPLLQMAPGARQLVRVIRSGPPPAEGQELAYRLIIDELPALEKPAAADGAPAAPSKARAGIQLQMRYSLPVFVGSAPNGEESKQLRWQLHKTPEQWQFSVHNTGTVRAQVADLEFRDAQGALHPVQPGLLGYVLPGNRMQWSVPAPPVALSQTIKGYEAMINRVNQPIHVEPQP